MKVQAMPINRGRIAREEALFRNVASVAAGLEALETLLIEKNVLKDGELMDKIKEILLIKQSGNNHMEGDDD